MIGYTPASPKLTAGEPTPAVVHCPHLRVVTRRRRTWRRTHASRPSGSRCWARAVVAPARAGCFSAAGRRGSGTAHRLRLQSDGALAPGCDVEIRRTPHHHQVDARPGHVVVNTSRPPYLSLLPLALALRMLTPCSS